MTQEIETMLAAQTYAVVGASRDAHKYGYLVYRALKATGKTVFAVNPRMENVDGDPSYPALGALPTVPEVAVFIVPASVTEAGVADCAHIGIRHVWMQPGAESDAAVAACRAAGITVVAGGPCIMVLLRTRGVAA